MLTFKVQSDNVATSAGTSYTTELSDSAPSALSTPWPTSVQQASVIMPPVSIPEVVVTSNVMPLPLIPVASSDPQQIMPVNRVQ